MNNISNYFISGLPIKSQLGTIYQPIIRELFEKDINYLKIASPFIMMEKLIRRSEGSVIEIVQEVFYTYELCRVVNIKDKNKMILSDIANEYFKSLKFLYDADNVYYCLDTMSILIEKDKDVLKINVNNITILHNIIFDMFQLDVDDFIKQEEPKPENELQKEFRRLREEHEKNKKEKDGELNLHKIINYVIHNSSQFTYEDVFNMTIYQLINTFKMYKSKEEYDIQISQLTSGNFKIEKFPKHWVLK